LDAVHETVSELADLLGSPVVFIKWPRGVKGTPRKWGHLTVADMTPEYLAKLPKGNIGVTLGEKSGGLCAIDFDKDEYIKPFLALNPHLGNTLQTHGARGRVFWVRFKGNYPKHTVKLKTQTGKDAGEFRSNGSQSIVRGIHPGTGQPYQYVVKQRAVEVEFNSVVWPTGIANPPEIENAVLGCTKGTQGTQSTQGTKVSKSSVVGCVELFYTVRSIDDALRVSLAPALHQNNRHLFTLARAIKTLEIQQGKFSRAQLLDVFNRWYTLTQAKKLLRNGQTKEEYMMEFYNACRCAKVPLGSALIAKAWHRATNSPLPTEAMQFEDPKLRLLVALCRELQVEAGSESFYLSARVAQNVLGQKTHSTAATWLGALVTLGILEITKPGNLQEATCYRYVWKESIQ
jgi:hypothetical protein